MQEAEVFCIALATFNAMNHLPSQINSIQNQTFRNWKLIIRDDGSTDGTVDYLEEISRADSRIKIIFDEKSRLGIKGNFSVVLKKALEFDAKYFALCDQDDVWHERKLSEFYRLLVLIPSGTPAAVYSDLRLVDAKNDILSPSHFRHAGAPQLPSTAPFWLIGHNLIPGCAVAGNQALLKLALPFPEKIKYHDWWILLLANACGALLYHPESLTDYRQHGKNAIGSSSQLKKIKETLIINSKGLKHSKSQLSYAVEQTNELINSHLPLKEEWATHAKSYYNGITSKNRWVRIRTALFGPVRRIGFYRQVLHCLQSIPNPENLDSKE